MGSACGRGDNRLQTLEPRRWRIPNGSPGAYAEFATAPQFPSHRGDPSIRAARHYLPTCAGTPLRLRTPAPGAVPPQRSYRLRRSWLPRLFLSAYPFAVLRFEGVELLER